MNRPERALRAGLLVLATVLATLATVSSPATAQACSCEAYDPKRSYDDADAVFVGETVAVRTAPEGDPAEFERRYLFDVTDVYKGEVYARQSVVSSTDVEQCGLPWDQEGAIAIVFGFAEGADTLVPGEFAATSCATTAFSPLSVVPEFGSPSPPIDGISPIGIEPPPTPEGGDVRFSWAWVAVGLLLVAGVTVGAWPRGRRSGTT
jgi:hypothetical protein